jgi:hypothetical protein
VKALLDAVLVDIGGTLVESAPAGSGVDGLEVDVQVRVLVLQLPELPHDVLDRRVPGHALEFVD